MTRHLRPWMALSFSFFAASVFAPGHSYAQNQMWGSGQYAAMPACSTEVSIGDEASSLKDELREREQELREVKSEFNRVKSRLTSIRTSVNSQRDLFKMTGFEGAAFNDIEDHINSGSSCRDYKGSCEYYRGGYSQNDGPEKYPYWYFAYLLNERMKGNMAADITAPVQVAAAPPTPSRRPAADLQTPTATPAPAPVITEEYTPLADVASPGAELPMPQIIEEPPLPYTPPIIREEPRPAADQCATVTSTKELRGFSSGSFLAHCGPGRGELRGSICNVEGVDSIPRGHNSDSCQRYLAAWIDKKKEQAELETQKLQLEAQMKELEALTKLTKSEIRDAIREYQREQREGLTEGGCIECMISAGSSSYQSPRTNIWETIGNFALAGLSIYGGMESSKYIADQNAKLGFKSTPMPLAGATMTYGWPYIQAGLQGVVGGGTGQGSMGCSGSAFNGGGSNGTYGFAGPAGNSNPYGVNGATNGSMWGMPQNYYQTPAGQGMFNSGAGPGFQAGFSMQNYCPVWPCPTSGLNGMNGMNGGMNGEFNGINMANPTGINPMMPGYLTSGASVGFNSGMGMNGMNGIGGMNGGVNQYMMGAGTGGANSGMMQYQMQQMQQQMAQQQYQMQMEMQNYQNKMAQQQALQGLYTEMNSLNMRIQNTQTQMSTGGMVGFDGSFMPGVSGQINGGYNTNMQMLTTPVGTGGVPAYR